MPNTELGVPPLYKNGSTNQFIMDCPLENHREQRLELSSQSTHSYQVTMHPQNRALLTLVNPRVLGMHLTSDFLEWFLADYQMATALVCMELLKLSTPLLFRN